VNPDDWNIDLNKFIMKKYLILLASLLILAACDNSGDTNNELTANKVVYPLNPGTGVVSGSVTITEKAGGNAEIYVKVTGTIKGYTHPAHLHLGDVGFADAPIIKLLTPLDGETGESVTEVNFLADGSDITFEELMNLEASIKIHQSDVGPEKDIVLAAGNIGMAFEESGAAAGDVAVCASED